ncbi:MAG: DMT family transporter [Bryobacterales bacterium]
MSPPAPSDVRRGAAFMLGAAAGFAGLGLLVKLVSGRLPPGEIVLWRTLATGAYVWAFAALTGTRPSLRPVRFRMHLVRAVTGIAAMTLYFNALARLGLGDAVLLTYLSPLLVAALSPLVVGERPTPRIWGALALGLVGVALVVGPAWHADAVGVLCGLSSACFSATAYLSVRVLNRTETPIAVVWWFSVLGAGLSSVSAADGLAPLDLGVGLVILGIGAFGAVAQWCLTMAYRQAPAASVSVYAYATPVFAYLAGLLVLGEVPAVSSALGAGVVALAGVIVATAP